MNVYIVYEINLGSYTQVYNFTWGNSLFGDVKLTKSADFDKHKYCAYGIGSDVLESFRCLMVVGLVKTL